MESSLRTELVVASEKRGIFFLKPLEWQAKKALIALRRQGTHDTEEVSTPFGLPTLMGTSPGSPAP
jgi:hypothetical protein